MSGKEHKPLLSAIVPCYNEQDNVELFYTTFAGEFDESEFDYQLVFIDDGSKDQTLTRLRVIAESHPHVRVISFSRNFGKESAVWAGLNNADGDFVAIIDADLQQQPQDLLNMARILERDDSYEVVAAYQEERRENPAIAFFKGCFYKVMDSMTATPVIGNASDFRVFRRVVADAILSLPEYYRFSKGIFSWVGFNTYAYPYVPSERNSGESKWNFIKLLKYAIEGLVSFSTSPLRWATYLGSTTSLIAFVYFVVVLIQKLCFGVDIPGYPTLVCLILLLGGIQLLVLGIFGEYMGRMYVQGKNRPLYIEARRYESDDQKKNASLNSTGE